MFPRSLGARLTLRTPVKYLFTPDSSFLFLYNVFLVFFFVTEGSNYSGMILAFDPKSRSSIVDEIRLADFNKKNM